MGRSDPLGGDPALDLVGVEADELADLDERDPVLGHQPADEDHFDAQPGRDGGHIEQGPGRRTLPSVWVRTFR